MTYFTMLVGIYFPSVTGEAPSLPSSSVFVSASLCVPTMTHSLSDSCLSISLLLFLSLGLSLFSGLCVYVFVSSVFQSSDITFPASSGGTGLSSLMNLSIGSIL